MESSKESKQCKEFGHIGPLQVGDYSLVCTHCNELLAGSLTITVADLIRKLTKEPRESE